VIRIVTVSGEYASGVPAIAEEVSARLGWRLWDKALTHRIAELARCQPADVAAREERTDPFYYRLFKSFLRGSFGAYEQLEMLDAERIAALTCRVVREAAAQGNCVLVGRGAPCVLRGAPGALHVFLHAPFESKVARLRSQGVSEEEARELIEVTDHQRGEFVRKFFGLKWPDRELYDLFVNSRHGGHAVAEVVLAAVAELQGTRAAAR
jgi:cytidylate kinase